MDVVDIITLVVAVLALVVSAISLFGYTQRDKMSFLRININSNKLLFTIDLENIGPSPAKIKEIKLQKADTEQSKNTDTKDKTLMTLFGAQEYTNSINSGKISIGSANWNVTGRMFSNLTGDVISGGGTKHHLFRCKAKDVDTLKRLWETIKDYEMTITYCDVYGILHWRKRECKSHFLQDFDSFKAAIGNNSFF